MITSNGCDDRQSFWKSHVDSWADAKYPITQKRFCAENQLPESTFSYWKSKLHPKLRRSLQKVSSGGKYWRKNIESWKNSNLTQSNYCHLHAESASSFSRWKNTLFPKTKGKRKTYRQKNKFFKNSKLSNEAMETLIQGFIYDTEPKVLSETAGISIKTCYRYLRRVESGFVVGAVNYPLLFNGSGNLLYQGPPPHIHNYLLERFKKNKKLPSSKQYMKILKRSIIYNACFDWVDDEIWFFYICGWLFLFERVYREKHGITGDYSVHYGSLMRAEYNEVDVVSALWNDYFTRGCDELVNEKSWRAVYHTHKFDDSKRIMRGIVRDTKWALINWNPLKRNEYWDEFHEKKSGFFDKVMARIDRSYSEIDENNIFGYL